jgi:predicted ArsR family transcriptional regulator
MSTKRVANLLKLIRKEPMTRADAAAAMGIAPTTMGYHFRALLAEGIVIDYPGPKGKTGPAQLLYTVSRRWRDDVDPRSSDPWPFPKPEEKK